MEFISKMAIDKDLFTKELDPVEFDIKKTFYNKNKTILLVCLGILMLFWKYTVALGIAILLAVISMFIVERKVKNPKWINDIKWRSRRQNRVFEEPIRYGFNDYGLLLTSEKVEVKVSWQYLNHYKFKGNWLRVTVYGIPDFFYNIEELKESNVYGSFIVNLEKYCKEIV
jgi:hypothetical protein